jgi:hypothetical protein
MIHSVLVFSFVMTIAVIFTFLSNNPEMSFITRDQFIWGIIAFLSFSQEAYIYLNVKIRYRCCLYAFLSGDYYHLIVY